MVFPLYSCICIINYCDYSHFPTATFVDCRSFGTIAKSQSDVHSREGGEQRNEGETKRERLAKEWRSTQTDRDEANSGESHARQCQPAVYENNFFFPSFFFFLSPIMFSFASLLASTAGDMCEGTSDIKGKRRAIKCILSSADFTSRSQPQSDGLTVPRCTLRNVNWSRMVKSMNWKPSIVHEKQKKVSGPNLNGGVGALERETTIKAITKTGW